MSRWTRSRLPGCPGETASPGRPAARAQRSPRRAAPPRRAAHGHEAAQRGAPDVLHAEGKPPCGDADRRCSRGSVVQPLRPGLPARRVDGGVLPRLIGPDEFDRHLALGSALEGLHGPIDTSYPALGDHGAQLEAPEITVEGSPTLGNSRVAPRQESRRRPSGSSLQGPGSAELQSAGDGDGSFVS